MNYDPNANVDDETCQYGGCIDSSASNYDETADVDDGSCLYPGCTDSAADNFDPGANDEDGSCIYFGCMDPAALNFEVFASVDDGSCFYGGALIRRPATTMRRPTSRTVPAPIRRRPMWIVTVSATTMPMVTVSVMRMNSVDARTPGPATTIRS